MTERVVPYDLGGVEWEPNAPDAELMVTDLGTARLTLQAHPDDTDESSVVLVWSGVLAARFGPYNDEGLHHHRLYALGLQGLLWLGEVLDSAWRTEVAPAVFRVPVHHYIVPTKSALVEVLADSITMERHNG